MAAHRRRGTRMSCSPSPGRAGGGRQVRVTVKYNRKELQRRLEVEKWIDWSLEELYLDQEEDMPQEVDIDQLLDLKTDKERTQRLQGLFHSCNNSTEVFICDLLLKLHGLQKQEDLHNDGIDLPQLHICSTSAPPAPPAPHLLHICSTCSADREAPH